MIENLVKSVAKSLGRSGKDVTNTSDSKLVSVHVQHPGADIKTSSEYAKAIAAKIPFAKVHDLHYDHLPGWDSNPNPTHFGHAITSPALLGTHIKVRFNKHVPMQNDNEDAPGRPHGIDVSVVKP